MTRRPRLAGLAAAGSLVAAGVLVALSAPASAVTVSTEAQLRSEFASPAQTEIVLANDIDLTDCGAGALARPPGAAALVLDGAGSTITQTCTGERVIDAQGAGLTVRNATVTGGNHDAGLAGGIYSTGGPLVLEGATVTGNRADDDTGGLAGGVFSNGDLTISGSVISDNVAGGGTSIFGGLGGALAANGITTITDSTISGNVAEGGETGGGDAGAIFGNNDVIIIRSTLSGNRAESGSTSGGGIGGAVAINADLTLVNSTVTGNVAQGADSNAGGVAAGGSITVVYSTVAGNSAANQSANLDLSGSAENPNQVFASVVADPLGGAPNCGGTDVISHGYNVSSDDSCSFTNSANGDRESIDPELGALASNGGPTMTMLPDDGSPLVDAIPDGECEDDGAGGVTTDQRGVARPQFDGCDIGAVEIEEEPVATTTTVGPGGTGATGGPSGSAPLVTPRFTG